MPFLSVIFSRIGGYIAAGLAVAAVLFGVYRSGRKSAQVDGMANQLENVEKSNEIENDIHTSSPDVNRERLHNEWSRD